MPTKWRQAFKEGVEAWQPAFAAAGFGDKAIRAVLPDDPDWPKDYAAGDIRCVRPLPSCFCRDRDKPSDVA